MNREPDIAGQRFGRLVALEKSGRDKGGRSLWKFKCDCGNTKILPSYVVRKWRTISCGCYRKDESIIRGKDLTGEKFGRLTVVERVGLDKHKQNLWKCKCECGREIIVNSNRLCTGKTRSCGCLRSGSNKRHGMCYSRLN